MADVDSAKKEEGQKEEKIDLQQNANEVLAGQVFKIPKEKKSTAIQNNDTYYNNEGDNGKSTYKEKNGLCKKEDQDEQAKKIEKNTVYLQKCYLATKGVLAEAVFIGGKPCFLVSRKEKPCYIEIQASIELDGEILQPCELSSYVNLQYGFNSHADLKKCIERTKEQTLESLYRKNNTIWRKLHCKVQTV